MPEKIKPTQDRFLPELVTALIQERGFDCDLNDIDVSDVRDFSRVFMVSHNPQFTGDISKWDVSNAITMRQMFETSEFNGDISRWNTRNVTGMSKMFCRAKFTGDLSQWDTSSVETMDSMFEFTKLNSDLSQWNVGKVKSMFRMFVGASFNQDIGGWDVSSCEDFTQMFLAAKFNRDISNWPVSMTASMPSMVEDVQLAGFVQPNMYHWHRLSSQGGPDIDCVPQEWRDHGVRTRELGLNLGMGEFEIRAWAHKTWQEAHSMVLALPDGLDAVALVQNP